MTVPLENLAQRLSEQLGGWDAIDGVVTEEYAQRDHQDRLDHASIHRQVFATENGAYVLEHLVRRYLRQRIVRPGDDQFAAGIRQGQADVVIWLLYLIEFANTGGGAPENATHQE